MGRESLLRFRSRRVRLAAFLTQIAYFLLQNTPPTEVISEPIQAFFASAIISSDAFWLNIMVGTTGNAPGTTGKALASTTLNP
jgi:hypothetical protein